MPNTAAALAMIPVLAAGALFASPPIAAATSAPQERPALYEPALYEEVSARNEERLIIAAPIGGRENHYWFDYRTNVGEARKELATDLRHVSDTEDLRDAWDEYRIELRHERRHYISEMAERGYRYGNVTVG